MSEYGKSRSVRWSWGYLALDESAADPAEWKLFTVEPDQVSRDLLLLRLVRGAARRTASVLIPNPILRAKMLDRLKLEGVGRGMDLIMKWEVPSVS